MPTTQIDGNLFASMVKGGAASLCRSKQIVNDLNVFPIPDGDTGDNMFMTIDAGVRAMQNDDSLSDVARSVAKGMLLGARGNSGVILSRIFSGISRGLEGKTCADADCFANALKCGIEESYGAVATPVEGTILTVYRDGVEYAASRIKDGSTVESFFDDFLPELHRSLDRTPDLLAVLQEAGVVDSGGAGFVCIAEGMAGVLRGEGVASYESAGNSSNTDRIDFDAFNEDTELKYGYCTEFLLRLQNRKTDIKNFDLDAFIAYLNSVGDSVVCFRDGSIVKVHVHTMRPGDILNHCQEYGEYLKLKIENMTLQHNETTVVPHTITAAPRKRKAYGIVAVASGSGLKSLFSELGCDAVVEGGQSMNPSAEDIVSALDKTNAETIFVFPNNSNIIMTAEQAASMYTDAKVVVIPTKTIGEGYAAVSMLDTSSGDTEAITAEVKEAFSAVKTGMVSRACRDAQKDGVEIKDGEYIGFCDKRIYTSCRTSVDATLDLAEKLGAGGYDIMMLICGEDAKKEASAKLYSELSNRYKRTEVILIDGYQPIYDYILILE